MSEPRSAALSEAISTDCSSCCVVSTVSDARHRGCCNVAVAARRAHLNLLRLRLVHEVRHLLLSHELRNDAKRIALVDEELLSLRRVEHLGRVLADEAVEEGIEALVVAALGAQNAPQALRLLAPRAKVARNLDQTRRLGQVDARVADLGEENRVDLRIVLEVLQNAHALRLRNAAVDVELVELLGVCLGAQQRQGAISVQSQRQQLRIALRYAPRAHRHCRRRQ
jgi:hypothetical protein